MHSYAKQTTDPIYGRSTHVAGPNDAELEGHDEDETDLKDE